MLRNWALAFGILVYAGSSVSAANLSVKINNTSGDTISSLMVTPNGVTEISSQNILVSPIASGETGEASLASDEAACVFTLTFTFASGTTLDRPDTDLCQTDSIVIE